MPDFLRPFSSDDTMSLEGANTEMNQRHATEMTSGDLELLTRIEELRSLFLSDPSVRERISWRAYQLYQRRGGEPGRDVEDWVQAENEILTPLIEEEIHRAARSAQTQPTQSAGIHVKNPPAQVSKSGVTRKGSVKSEEADSGTSNRDTKKKVDKKGKGKKKKSKSDKERE